MQIIPLLLKEFDQEIVITQQMLQRVPDDKFGWKPHEKSMTMLQLTTHIAELPGFITLGLNTTEMDFATNPYTPTVVENTTQLLEVFEKTKFFRGDFFSVLFKLCCRSEGSTPVIPFFDSSSSL